MLAHMIVKRIVEVYYIGFAIVFHTQLFHEMLHFFSFSLIGMSECHKCGHIAFDDFFKMLHIVVCFYVLIV